MRQRVRCVLTWLLRLADPFAEEVLSTGHSGQLLQWRSSVVAEQELLHSRSTCCLRPFWANRHLVAYIDRSQLFSITHCAGSDVLCLGFHVNILLRYLPRALTDACECPSVLCGSYHRYFDTLILLYCSINHPSGQAFRSSRQVRAYDWVDMHQSLCMPRHNVNVSRLSDICLPF